MIRGQKGKFQLGLLHFKIYGGGGAGEKLNLNSGGVMHNCNCFTYIHFAG